MRIFLVPVNGRKMKIAGFTLMEMMTAVAVAAILVVIAYPAYQSYIRKTRLNKSLTAMMDNSQFLERYYANHYNFKKNSTTWADIPHTETDHFCIRMQGNPRGTISESVYAMKAVAFDKNAEPRVLIVNQDHTVLLCENSTSTCDEKEFFKNPARADTDCTSYQQ